jgi:Catalase
MTGRTPLMIHATGTPVVDNTNIQTAGPRGPTLLQAVWLIENMAHSAVGKRTPLFVPTSARTAYGAIDEALLLRHSRLRALCCPINGTSRREP